MSSEEENLDDLLKSIMEGDEESNHSNNNENSTEDIESIDETLTLDDLDFAIEESGEDENLPLDLNLEFALEEPEEDDDMLSSDFDVTMEGVEEDVIPDINPTASEDFSLDDFAIQEPDIDDIDMDSLEFDDAMDSEETEEELFSDGIMSLDDVDAIFASADAIATTDAVEDKNVDADIAEISELLQSDSEDLSDGMADDEMLALLASMTSDIEEDDANYMADSLEGIADYLKEAEEEEQEDSEDKKKKKEKKGSFFKRMKGRKKSKEDQEEAETETGVEIEQDMDFQSELETPLEEIETEAEAEEETKPVKQNIFSKFLSFLTETDEDDETEKIKKEHGMEPSDENKNILEELDAEDKKKKKKKVRGKGKKADKEETDNQEVDESLDEEQDKPDTKKKKEKKVKVQKEIPAISSKPEKKISKKSVSLIIGFSLTITVVIVVFCVLIPGILDKRKARDAYYTADYKKAYELLYGKELDNSDTLIFNKSKTILEMNRKLTSYHNYMGMGMEVQALDALMSAVEKYPDILVKAEEYHVTQEVNAIYTTILNILNDRYYMIEPLAQLIVAYEDDVTYTRKLESIVYGTPFLEPVEVTESAAPVSDVLPEEQAIIDDNMLDLTQEDNTSIESNDNEQPSEEGASNDSSEVVQQEPTEDTIVPEQVTQDTQAASESESQQVPVESNSNSGGQGQLIQGLRQPITIEINEN